MSELLPCPFCGSPAALNFGNDGDLCNVRCSKWSVGTCLGAGPNCYHRKEAIAGWNRRTPSSPATEPDERSKREASDSATKLAELILSDCGHSTAITTALRDRVALRIDRYTDALAEARALSAPTEPAQAEFKLPTWTDEAPDWCTPKELEVWQMGYDCAMGSARSMNSPETISAVLRVPSGFTFDKVIAAVSSEDLVSLTPTAPAPTEPVAWATFRQVTVALAGLLEQVEKFTSEHGEADFETAEALRAVEAAIVFDRQMVATPPSAAAQPEAVGWRSEMAEQIRQAHDLSLDGEHRECRTMLLKVATDMLASAPTTEATSSPSDAERLDWLRGLPRPKPTGLRRPPPLPLPWWVR